MKTKLIKTIFLNLLLIACLPSLGKASPSSFPDSIGIIKKEDKYFIMHKIVPKETLSGIAKRYKVSMADLQKANTEILKKDKIKSGQVILVPALNVAIPPTYIAPVIAIAKKNNGQKEKWHIIKEYESLYKIAATHNVHVDSIKTWNNLSDNGIKANSKLIVGYTTFTEEPYVPKSGINVAKESGMGEMITGTNNTGLKLALHRTLPTGSFVRVSNEGNGASVVVKIIGKIPDVDSDEKIIIKLSQAACKSIGMVNERFPITITYEKKKK